MEDIERQAREQDRRQRHLAFGEGVSADRGREEAHQSILPSGQILPFDRAVVDDEGERDCDHREIGPPDTQCGQRKQRPDAAGCGAGHRKREPEAHALHGQYRRRVGADGVEADMAERDLSRKAEQDVQPHTDDCGERDERQNKMRVPFRGQHQCGTGCRQRHDGERHHRERGRFYGHTFFVAARPSSPFGIAASARMTTANTTICV